MQIVITAAASSEDNFLQAGFTRPKNLVSFRGISILEYVIRQYEDLNAPITVTLDENECREFKTDQIILRNHPEIRVVQIPSGNHGALCSALLGIDETKPGPLVVVPGDSACRKPSNDTISKFKNLEVDAGTFIFRSDSPRWSYVRTNNKNDILEIAEKRVISEFATTGLFYFRDVETFIDGATWALVNATNLNGRYYVSHSLHKILAMQKKVIAHTLDDSRVYLSFSSPAELAQRLEEDENR